MIVIEYMYYMYVQTDDSGAFGVRPSRRRGNHTIGDRGIADRVLARNFWSGNRRSRPTDLYACLAGEQGLSRQLPMIGEQIDRLFFLLHLDTQVTLGRGQTGMAQQALDRADVGASPEELSRKRMAQLVRADVQPFVF